MIRRKKYKFTNRRRIIKQIKTCLKTLDENSHPLLVDYEFQARPFKLNLMFEKMDVFQAIDETKTLIPPTSQMTIYAWNIDETINELIGIEITPGKAFQ